MRTIFVCIFFVLIYSCKAQITWCYKNDNSFNGISHHHSYLNGQLFTSSVSFSTYYYVDNSGNSTLAANVRSDSTGRVYASFIEMGVNPPEILLYDFSLNIGDTMHYEYGGLPGGYISQNYHYKVVEDTGSIFINGQTKKTMTLFSYGGYAYYESSTHFWIEGYGSMISKGFANPLEIDMILNGDGYSFNCLKEDGVELYSTGTCLCFLYDQINDHGFSMERIIYSNNKIQIAEEIPCFIQIFNEIGELVLSRQLTGPAQIDLEMYPKGCYIIKFSTSGYVINRKIIKI